MAPHRTTLCSRAFSLLSDLIVVFWRRDLETVLRRLPHYVEDHDDHAHPGTTESLHISFPAYP